MALSGGVRGHGEHRFVGAAPGLPGGRLQRSGCSWPWVEEGGDQERDLAASWRSRAQRLAFDYPFVSTTLDGIAMQYEREGALIDTEVHAWKRTGP